MSMFVLAGLLAGCAGEGTAEITGSVDGLSITPTTLYWGGPFINFVSRDLDCDELAWVSKVYEEGEEPPTDFDFTMLQISYSESDVVTGTYDLSGQAPVKAEVVNVTGAALTVFKANEGTLIIDEVVGEEDAVGSFAFTFDDFGTLTGDFAVPWCTNLKSRT
ncbi:MAG: hypothetical protein P8R54_08575 [Myxococcota bacterium]|nr:hypothetical protein [Myxococcota bacterium]